MKKLLSLLMISVILCASMAGALPVYAVDHDHLHIYDFVEAIVVPDDRYLLSDFIKVICEDHGIEIVYAIIGEEDGDTVEFTETLYSILWEDEGYGRDMLLLTYNEFLNEYYSHAEGRAYEIFSEEDLDVSWDVYFDQATYEDAVLSSVKVIDTYLVDVQLIPEDRQLPLLVDDANLLTDSEEATLLALLEDISTRQECDVAIITVDSLGNKSSEAFADDFYDYNGYGYGPDDDGILFLISMEERDWAISTFGFGIPAFTDAGQERIISDLKTYLSNGDYNKAFTIFATSCDKYLTQARTGEPYDYGNMPKYTMQQPLYNVVFSLVVGAAISWSVMKKMTAPLKTVKKESRADKYEREGSMYVRASRESFLYNSVSKTAKAPPSSGGSSSGGSSTRSSSSGRSHGGSSGKF